MERTIRSLTRHYPRRDETVVQVLAVVDRFAGLLNPEQSDFTYDDGRVELLLSLTGVLPIPIQTNVYHCPIVFWLPLDYPSTPPIVFILPSETLAVRKGKNVDAGGRVNVQYLEQWSRKSEGCSLLSLIEELIPIFSARYPVTTIQPKAPAPARPSPPAVSQTIPVASSSSTSPAIQAIPPRPPLPTGSPATHSADGSAVRPPPPRPPLPDQSVVNGRPASVSAAETLRRPPSFTNPVTTNGLPPRPPLPPGSAMINSSSTLPPGPPPGYRPPPAATNSIPPYSIPQRSATPAAFSSSETRLPPHPAAFSREAPQPPLPPQGPAQQGSSNPPLGPPIAAPHPDDPSRRFSSPPPPLPFPGTFSPPRPSPGIARDRPEATTSRPQGHLPPRPPSPTASTVRAFSPAPSSVGVPPSNSIPSPRGQSQYDPRLAVHQRSDSFESHPSNRFSREYADSNRPYSPSPSTIRPPSPPPARSQQARMRPPSMQPPTVQPYSPANSLPPTIRPPLPPTSDGRSPQIAHPSQRTYPHSSSGASVASMSEYDAEYGSYMPPALSSTSISVTRDENDHSRRAESISSGTERLSLGRERRANPAYEPYQPATLPSDNRIPHPPRPPSAVFEPTVEPRSGRYVPPSFDSASQISSSYYSAAPTPPTSRLPPPVSYAQSPAPVPRQVMRNPIRKPFPPPPSSSTASASVNILDAGEDLESPTSVNVPTSPTSASIQGASRPARSTASKSQAPPPIPPNPALLALRTRLHSKLSSTLSTLHSETTQNHLEPLSLMHSDLLKAVPAIEDEMARLRAVRDVCLNVRNRYQEVVEEGEKRMGEYERRGEGVDVDEIVCGSTVVYTQLLDLVADDSALEDTIYALGRGLNSGTANIDLDQFLKRVRTLAREQFIKRATINKILLGLAIRRERNQQRERQHAEASSRSGSGQGGRGTPTVI
ncbi:uncharacterized protein JCM6883_001996 [Sporobolomyces salmoneus]|uniref:uncharacterized protein n=1 Tax=Sporobolomyces salmoneus TaxID=183962 RepID=UPI00316F7521